MGVTFLEPGGDSTFDLKLWVNGLINQTPAVATDFVRSFHKRSIKYRPGNQDILLTPAGAVGTNSRTSGFVFFHVLPSGSVATFWSITTTAFAGIASLRITSGGVLQLWSNTAQIGSNGPTLSTGTWYRISICCSVTSTSVNQFTVYVDGSSVITGSNATLANASPSRVGWGNSDTDAALDFRSSDHYVDNTNSQSDMGKVEVTAKRPFANGTTNGFLVQVGSGGSGYGTGHAPQVNERPLSTTNGWQTVVISTRITEEYSVEAAGVGDVDISAATFVGAGGWVYGVSTVSDPGMSLIVCGQLISETMPTSNTLVYANSAASSYPAGGTDIGVETGNGAETFTLYECGLVVAFIAATASAGTAGNYYRNRRLLEAA